MASNTANESTVFFIIEAHLNIKQSKMIIVVIIVVNDIDQVFQKKGTIN